MFKNYKSIFKDGEVYRYWDQKGIVMDITYRDDLNVGGENSWVTFEGSNETIGVSIPTIVIDVAYNSSMLSPVSSGKPIRINTIIDFTENPTNYVAVICDKIAVIDKVEFDEKDGYEIIFHTTCGQIKSLLKNVIVSDKIKIYESHKVAQYMNDKCIGSYDI